MLDDFQSEQLLPCNLLLKELKNNKLNHAYLFESNGCNNTFEIALSFAKAILCPKNYSNDKKCHNCHQCQTIDDNNYLDLKIIEANGMWIKKEQLIDLQSQFVTKSVIGNKKIYIIKEAEKLNNVSANSLLKFIEEPLDDVIAILITNSRYQLLKTIVSRCQIISFCENSTKGNNMLEKIGNYLYNTSDEVLSFTSDDKSLIKINKVINFVDFYEKNGIDTILYTENLWTSMFKTKEDFLFAFEILILFYQDVLLFACGRKINYFEEKIDFIKQVAGKNNYKKICNKIEKIIEMKEKIKFNANSNLLLDKLLLVLERS